MNGISGLLGSELRRFFSRRVMRGALAFGIALSTLVLVIQIARSEVATSTQKSNNYVCGGPVGSAPGTPNGPTVGGIVPPGDCTLQTVTARVRHDRRLDIGRRFSETVNGAGVAMVFVAFVIGASFVGAEFGAGSLSTQLIFEPRRKRLIAVKTVAVGIGLAVLAIAVLLYIGLLLFVGSELRGVTRGLVGSWFAGRAGDVGRVTAAVAFAGISAFAITVVARRTVAAVAGLLIVGWASAIIGSLHHWRWVAKYNPATAFFAMAANPTHGEGRDTLITAHGAAVSALAWGVGLTIVAAVIFDRREVR